jgi:SpoVK/Ycf46/Vps4 family AAA+-type ATPase
VYKEVLADIKTFWLPETEAKYRKHKFSYKRGMVLHGQQGNGKSTLVHLLAQYLTTKMDGVVFDVGSPDQIFSFEQVFNALREINPDIKVIAVFEDADNFVRYGGSTATKLLNILDGNMRYDNIVFLATTNFIEVLLQSMRNRPSRFDRIYEIAPPSEEARRVYITKKFPNLQEAEVAKLVGATEGFTIDMLKEAVLSIYVLGQPFDKVMGIMKSMFSARPAGAVTDAEVNEEVTETTEEEPKKDEEVEKENYGSTQEQEEEQLPEATAEEAQEHKPLIAKKKSNGEN